MMEAQLSQTTAAATTGGTGPRARIREFVTTNFYVADPAKLEDSASLLDAGVIDSTGVLEVIAFLESEYGIQVADAEIVPENLDSIERIESYVRRKTA